MADLSGPGRNNMKTTVIKSIIVEQNHQVLFTMECCNDCYSGKELYEDYFSPIYEDACSISPQFKFFFTFCFYIFFCLSNLRIKYFCAQCRSHALPVRMEYFMSHIHVNEINAIFHVTHTCRFHLGLTLTPGKPF